MAENPWPYLKRVRPMKKIRPIILSGGSGTRLWPYSRKSYPKQFLPLVGSEPLFTQTCKRVMGPLFAPPFVLCNNDHRFIVAEILDREGFEDARIVLEPVGRNTAPTALTAALMAAAEDQDALLLMLPSDHVIADVTAFLQAVEGAVPAAQEGHIVTFGIVPDKPHTGYGYIQTADGAPPQAVVRFKEKPDEETARAYVESGRYFWNAGITLFAASTMIAAFERFAPDYLEPCRQGLARARTDLDFLRLDREAYAQNPSNSLEYALIEQHPELIRCMPMEAGWNDLGSWTAVKEINLPDGNNNVALGDAELQDCANTLVHSTDGILVSLLGVRDLVVVATQDAVLVADQSHAQDIGRVVRTLQKKHRPEAAQHRQIFRPWGSYQRLIRSESYQVKKLVVKAGKRLSMQRHTCRSEHWIVVSGKVRVVNTNDPRDQKPFDLLANQSTYIPAGNWHRLENPGEEPAVLIEVQTGSYLGEDDIERLDDDFGRIATEAVPGE